MFKLHKMPLRAGFAVLVVLAMILAGSYIPSRVLAANAPTMGAAASYSVLAGSIVTNTGPTTMTGDLGISPSIGVPPHFSGFPPGIVSGTIHDADANAGLAQAANTAAFGFLDQPSTVTYPGVKDLTGLSLVPGVYSADAFQLSGTLTLVGSGVWIFKSASTLITSGTANIVGGTPCSVWWRVVSSATLGTNTQMIGHILALTSISLQTGAILEGQALAQTGAVTMDSNQITTPLCGAHLSLTKTVSPATFNAIGNILTYTLVATNDGSVTLTNVSISDPGLNITGSTPAQPATLAPGDTLTVTGTRTVASGDLASGSLTNTATASGTGAPVSAPASVTAFLQKDTPHLTLTKMVNPTTYAVVGDILTYTLIATNDGDVTLTNVSISDPGLTITGSNPAQPATLAPGATLTVTGTRTVSQGDINNGSLTNTGTASGTPPEGSPVSATASATTTALQVSHLSLTKKVSPSTYNNVGDVLTYTLVATNDGNVTLTNVSISDPGLTITGSTPAQPATLAPGATLTVIGTRTISQGDLNNGLLKNAATASGTPPTGGPISGTANVTATANGTLKIFKFEDKNWNGIKDTTEPVLPGWTFTISGPVGYNSTGVTDSSGFIVLTKLPPGSYTVTETPKPGGWVPTNGAGTRTVIVPAGGVAKLEFGNEILPATPASSNLGMLLMIGCFTVVMPLFILFRRRSPQ